MNPTNIWAPTVLGADDEKTKISPLNKLVFLPEGKCQANNDCSPLRWILSQQQDTAGHLAPPA